MTGNGKMTDVKRVGGSSKKVLSFLRTFASNTRGFTSIELVIVILVLSVLTASIIIKNPFSISDYSSIAADQLIADIQYVQMRAMGLRSSQAIALRINASDYGIYSVAGVQKKLPGPLCQYK